METKFESEILKNLESFKYGFLICKNIKDLSKAYPYFKKEKKYERKKYLLEYSFYEYDDGEVFEHPLPKPNNIYETQSRPQINNRKILDLCFSFDAAYSKKEIGLEGNKT